MEVMLEVGLVRVEAAVLVSVSFLPSYAISLFLHFLPSLTILALALGFTCKQLRNNQFLIVLMLLSLISSNLISILLWNFQVFKLDGLTLPKTYDYNT